MFVPVRRALLSVSDKTGVLELARQLVAHRIEILSTGGTARLLADGGVTVQEVSAYTGFPEIMGGRVKTLHPRIHGGLLGRRGTDDAVMEKHGIAPLDLLVVNLYPFAATLARRDCSFDDAVENIDIGGPAMLRAGAKNHAAVTVLVDPADYADVLAELAAQRGSTTPETRARLAAKAFAHTAQYDVVVANWLRAQQRMPTDDFPQTLPLIFTRHSLLRYGENPHQRAAFYRDVAARGASIAAATMLQGKALSFNNIADGDTAVECVRQFDATACVIVKHANPCGVALAATQLLAYERAYQTDPTSAFGGIIAFNQVLDGATARAIVERQFVEVVAAPAFSVEALAALAGKANIRVLELGDLAAAVSNNLEYRSVSGGLLAQSRDSGSLGPADLKIVTRRSPSTAELLDMMFAWRVCKYVKSNAIVYARDCMTIGVGAGQMSRVYSSRVAALKAADEKLSIKGAAMASDAFFPFRDGLDVAAAYGIRAVIQPGGSKRDDEVIAAADENDITMAFTGIRHFRH